MHRRSGGRAGADQVPPTAGIGGAGCGADCRRLPVSLQAAVLCDARADGSVRTGRAGA